MSLRHVRKLYGVPARWLGRVRFTGGPTPQTGKIRAGRCNYLMVRMDGAKEAMPFHPTWWMTYLDRSGATIWPMITEAEIVETLTPLNGLHFSVPSLPVYARKVLSLGKSIIVRDMGTLDGYVLYYDNGPAAFITMVWVRPERRGAGLATAMVMQVIAGGKDVELDVHADNPAQRIYERLGFEEFRRDGHTIGMRRQFGQPAV